MATILMDVDDVVADLCGAWVRALNLQHGTSVQPEDITSWDIWRFFPDVARDDVYEPLYEVGFYSTVEPIEGAPHMVKTLRAMGHRVVFVTSSNLVSTAEKGRWLFRHGLVSNTWDREDGPFGDFAPVSDKSLIRGDVMVDDRPENLLASWCPHRILFDRPHNRQDLRWRRATSPDEVCAVVEDCLTPIPAHAGCRL